jgi:5-methylcytosine-specific restriction protein A
MPNRPKFFCRGKCGKLINGSGYCPDCEKKQQKIGDLKRGTAHQRGYTSRWQRYSKWFLSQPENQFCKYNFPGCNELSQCVDHRIPPKGKDDPLFWDKNNHVASCIRCNSVKGKRVINTNSDG